MTDNEKNWMKKKKSLASSSLHQLPSIFGSMSVSIFLCVYVMGESVLFET